jgi:sulfur carrier protein
MNLTVNGAEMEVSPDTTVDALVVTLGRSPRGIAVARNGEVVPRSTWADEALRAGDEVEVLEAAQGG